MTEYLRVRGVPKAENDLSACQYVEYVQLKVTEYLPVPGAPNAENDYVLTSSWST